MAEYLPAREAEEFHSDVMWAAAHTSHECMGNTFAVWVQKSSWSDTKGPNIYLLKKQKNPSQSDLEKQHRTQIKRYINTSTAMHAAHMS